MQQYPSNILDTSYCKITFDGNKINKCQHEVWRYQSSPVLLDFVGDVHNRITELKDVNPYMKIELDIRKLDDCFWCGQKESKLSCCSQCCVTLYCSKRCQKKDWKTHKLICLSLANEKKSMENAGFKRKIGGKFAKKTK